MSSNEDEEENVYTPQYQGGQRMGAQGRGSYQGYMP